MSIPVPPNPPFAPLEFPIVYPSGIPEGRTSCSFILRFAEPLGPQIRRSVECGVSTWAKLLRYFGGLGESRVVYFELVTDVPADVVVWEMGKLHWGTEAQSSLRMWLAETLYWIGIDPLGADLTVEELIVDENMGLPVQ